MRSKTPKGRGRGSGGGRGKGKLAAAPPPIEGMEGMSPAGGLSLQLEHVSLFPSLSDPPSRFQMLIDSEVASCELPLPPPPLLTAFEAEEGIDDKDCILSQDFFCTPDYITPDFNLIDSNKENIPCPKSPEKTINGRNKRHKGVTSELNSLSTLPCCQLVTEVSLDDCDSDQIAECKTIGNGSQKKRNYVSKTAVALRCRVMPPPCIKNPYISLNSSTVLDVYDDRRTKFTGLPSVGGDGLSRYRTDFHEIEQIGCGNFSHVFKVLKRIDGCLYAVKKSIRQLHQDMDRRRALSEVQALAALGSHENIVGYYSSWFENEQLYIQLELCDRSLSISKCQTIKGGEILKIMYQIAKALHFMHGRGIAHLDVKPENIYVKDGVYKLGDFGCATLMDRSLPIEEGDSRYMPLEMLNDKYGHLDKVDIFSLGAATYELVKGSPLPDSGPQFSNLREGRIPLLPGYPIQFQNLLKAMMHHDPEKRPSAKELLENPIFRKINGAIFTRSHWCC